MQCVSLEDVQGHVTVLSTVTDPPTEATTFAPDRELCFLNQDDKKALPSRKMNKPFKIRIVECKKDFVCQVTSPPFKLLGMELGYVHSYFYYP